MKNTFKYIAFGIALLASSFALNAQQGTYHREGGMATSKKVTGPVGGYYTISLESFATGKTTVTESSTPVDIVLVLDVSGSMDQNLNRYTYNALTSQAYSYNSYGDNTYYYLHTDGEYYPVNRERPYVDGVRRRRLYFDVGSTRYYLSGTGVTTTPPDNVTSNGGTIWTGVLYDRHQLTKMEALKNAVQAFVEVVNHNANFDSKEQARTSVVHNRISIVKYADDSYYGSAASITPGNNRDNNGYNYTQVLVGFTDVSTDDGMNRVMGVGNYTGVLDLQAGGATAADYGMTKATYLMETVKNDDSNKVVVLFTDGEPNHFSGFDTDVADDTIEAAYTLKHTYEATVFTIGVFNNETTQIKNYMNWASSNYPNQEHWVNNGSTITPATGSYYQNASNADLTEIFKGVASASAASDATAGASTQVRDVISNSFIMPEGDAAQITIGVSTITTDGEGWSDPVEQEGIGYEITTVTTTTGEQHKQLMVTGFDYTKPDTYNADGFTITPGNWVGERYSNATTKYWAGKKLIITFRIKANDEATGGDGSSTNHPDSGIYVQKFNEDGTPVLVDGKPVYEKVNQYDVPHTDLPLLIKIKKDGLRLGESATFQLLRIRPKGWNNDGATLAEKMKNVEYNAIGKPKPDTHDFVDHITKPDGTIKQLDEDDPVDYLLGCGWEDWSKVILTNKKGDDAFVEKDLYGLDPSWVYMVVEDDWGWAYILTGTASHQTTSDYEINPFEFHNTPRTVNLEGNPIVKHAEAVTINHFKTLEEGSTSREEHYKSSKTNFKSK